MKPVFAIMVTYRRFEHFKKTVESLLPTLPEGSKLVIVDNYTEGEEVYEFMRSLGEYKRVKVEGILLDKNVGWGAAMNEGLRCHPEWREYGFVLESNNDVWYSKDWFVESQILMNKYQKIGILGLWKHPYHGVQLTFTDLLVKDDMPAVAWFMRSKDLSKFLPFPEKGKTKIAGGNGEDCDFTSRVKGMGYWVAAPKNDLAEHMDGPNLTNLGKDNPAYL